jgi:hypothetical protein
VGVKLADFGSCFAAAGVDTARLSFELQTLSYRAPEASVASLQPCSQHRHWSLAASCRHGSAVPKLVTLQGGAWYQTCWHQV